MSTPRVRYARNGDVHLAYTVTGDGPRNLLFVPGYLSHLDLLWEWPRYRRFLDRLSSISRLVVMDRRGCGLSDRTVELLAVEQQVDDVLAVLDDAGIETAIGFGSQDGAATLSFLAASHPDRLESLIIYGARARFVSAPDYPWGNDRETLARYITTVVANWGTVVDLPERRVIIPSLVDDPAEHEWWARFNRSALSPGGAKRMLDIYTSIDVRAVLGAIRVPTLVLNRADDELTVAGNAEYIAGQVPGATLRLLPGSDVFFPAGDMDAVAEEVEEFVTGTRRHGVEDRVLATVLCTDIVGSTERLADLGDRRWRQTLDEHDRLTARLVGEFRGRVVASTGDGVLATFDGPARAIRCAQAISAAAQSLDVDIRSGIHTGEVELRGSDIAGLALHVAVRIQAAADPGEVLVSSTVRDLVAGSGIAFDSRGEHQLKGVPGTWELLAANR